MTRLVRLQFTGTPATPSLPTWSYVADAGAGAADLLIKDEDAPQGEPTTAVTQNGTVVIGLSAAGLAAWHGQLDSNYPENAGQYRPVFP